MSQATESELSRFAGLTELLMRQLHQKGMERMTIFEGTNGAGDITLDDNGIWQLWFMARARMYPEMYLSTLVEEYAQRWDPNFKQILEQEWDSINALAEHQDRHHRSNAIQVSATNEVADDFFNQREAYMDEHWPRLAAAVLDYLASYLENTE